VSEADRLRALSDEYVRVEPLPANLWSPAVSRLRGLRKLLIGIEPNIVHVLGEAWQAGTLQALRAGRSLGAVPGLHFAENGPGLGGGVGRIRKFLGKVVLDRASYAVGWSGDSIHVARDAWNWLGPTAVFPGIGVPREFFDAAKPLRERSAQVIFVGRLSEEKGVKDVLSLAVPLRERSVRVVVVGDGPLRSTVQLAHDNGLINYVGATTRQNVARLMADSLITLVPSRPGIMKSPKGAPLRVEEQFGMVIVESMASQTPVVAYETGAIPEVMGQCGLLVERNTPALLVAVSSLLSDEQLWMSHSKASAAHAKQYSEEAIAAKLSEFWRLRLEVPDCPHDGL